MKSWCVLVVYVAVVPAFVLAQEASNVRPLDPSAAEALERGLARSARVRALVGELRHSDVIVHILTAHLPRSTAGRTRFVSRSGGYRYIRIELDRSLLPDTRAAILGHELQHACEIARSKAATREAIRELFVEIGTPVDDEAYDTPAAAQTTKLVWQELRSGQGVRATHE